VHTSLFLNCDRLKKRVVASVKFHGKPRFDTVLLKGVNPQQQVVDWYAKVHLIFTVKFRDDRLLLVFLQYFDVCRGAPVNFPLVTLKLGTLYGVVNIHNVVDTIQIAPHFRQPGIFHEKKCHVTKIFK